MSGGRDRAAREARQRAQIYEARVHLHEARRRRRRRDNIVATSVATGIVALAVGGQALFYGAGPGAAEPAPAGSSSPAPLVTPTTGATETPAP